MREITFIGHVLAPHQEQIHAVFEAHGLQDHVRFAIHLDPWNRNLPGTVPFPEYDIAGSVERGLRHSVTGEATPDLLWDYEGPNWAYNLFRRGPRGIDIAFNRYVLHSLDTAIARHDLKGARKIQYGAAWNPPARHYTQREERNLERAAPMFKGWDLSTVDCYPRDGGALDDPMAHQLRAIIGCAYLARATGASVMPILEIGPRARDTAQWFETYCDALRPVPVNDLAVWTHGALDFSGPYLANYVVRELDKVCLSLGSWLEA